MSRWQKFALALGVIALVLVPIRLASPDGPIRWAASGEQSAWAATLQTIGLVGTLLFAA